MPNPGADLLILKLTIVPLALLIFGIVERLHGPRIAGWLAGFPIVGGPLLVFVTLEQGKFGSAAALGAYFGLVPGWPLPPLMPGAAASGAGGDAPLLAFRSGRCWHLRR